MGLRKPFVVRAVLVVLTVLAGCGSSGTTITNPAGHSSGGFSKSNLNGSYVFSVS